MSRLDGITALSARAECAPVVVTQVGRSIFARQVVAQRRMAGGGGGKVISVAAAPPVKPRSAAKAAVIAIPPSAGRDLIAGGASAHSAGAVDAVCAAGEKTAPGQKTREAGSAMSYGGMGTAGGLTGMAALAADNVVARTHKVDGGPWMS